MANLTEIFRDIDGALSENSSRLDDLEAVYQFELSGNESGVYQIVLRGEKSYAAEGQDEKADCILKLDSEDFKKMVEGELNGTQAFMSGRLKVQGNMGLALKLQEVLSAYRTLN